MIVNKEIAKFLRENGCSDFVVRSKSHSGNYHVLLGSDRVRETLEKYHALVWVKTVTGKDGKLIEVI